MTGLAVVTCEDIAWFRDDPSLPAAARGVAATLARRIGLSSNRAAEVAIAVTEAASNLSKHATDGALLLRVLRTENRAGVEFLTVDAGPGIRDVAAAMSDGVSSAGTLGIGLGAVARLADSFDIHSLPGQGTVIAAQFWTPAGSAAPSEPSVASGITRPISGESVCGDAWSVRVAADPAHRDGEALLVMMSDGLGHGPQAARAGEAAVRAFQQTSASLPEEILRDIHLALRGTRGAAAAVARIEPAARRILYCGSGNISGFLLGPDSRSGLLSAPGIVGQQMHKLRTFELPLNAGGALVMHSDGLTERRTTTRMPGLLQHTPAVIAGHFLREAGIRRDDAGIVVVKGAW